MVGHGLGGVLCRFLWANRYRLGGNISGTGFVRDPNKLSMGSDTTEHEHHVSIGLPTDAQVKVKTFREPSKLSIRQSEIIERLIEKYGDDLQGMRMDMKMNPFQLSAGQLRKHIESYKYWGRREQYTVSTKELKKLRWYNDPLKPNKRLFVNRQ